MTAKRKVAVVVTHRAPYGRLRPVLRALGAHPNIDLHIIVGVPMSARHLWFALRHGQYESLRTSLPWLVRARFKTLVRGGVADYELLAQLILKDGFVISGYVPMFLQGGDLATMLKTQANVLYELPKTLRTIGPDVLLVHADRFEMLPVAMVGATLNIPTAHTQGGDVSGTIDETVRHAITKLAHIHFPTTEKSKERILQMGEDPSYVFMTGCPTIDGVKSIELGIDDDFYERAGPGYGDKVNLREPFLLVMQHPVTSEYSHSRTNMEAVLAAVRNVGMPTLLFAPNIDGGTDGATAAVREFLKDHGLSKLALYKTLNTDDFYRTLNAASVAVGNSSSFIREGSYLGTPVVMVGTRQQARERAVNIMDADYKAEEIEAAIRAQLAHGKYEHSLLYGDGTASKKIAHILATVDLPLTQKTFFSTRRHSTD